MSLKPFQLATVERVLDRLKDARGSRRFLVADEVGLGKTLVAQGVIEGLCQPSRQLRVFYICSSLSIAHQNRESLLEMLPQEEREGAKVEVDRLTLLPKANPPADSAFVLYTLTPGTMPLRSSGGRVDERALLASLIRDVLDLRRDNRVLNLLKHGVSDDTWRMERQRAEDSPVPVPRELLAAFRRHLTRLLKPGADIAWTSTIVEELTNRLEEAPGASIQLLRQALSLASLESLAPDLIIFDEFQRFFELFDEEDDDLDDVARSLMDRLLGTGDAAGARVLMLSATPYRLFGGWDSGDGAHHGQLFALLRFLFGSGNASKVAQLRKDFDEYGQRLRNDAPFSSAVLAVRDRIQDMLGLVMARTERTDGDEATSPSSPEALTSPLEPLDVRLLRHLRDSARPEDRWSIQAYWSSIPYPLQSMDTQYLLRARAEDLPLQAVARESGIRTNQVFGYSPIHHSHPKLRQLLRDAPPELLSLPWLPPTMSWWPLGGQFAATVARMGAEAVSKTLLFSRYRAVPRAISSVLSYEAERRAFAVQEQRARGLKKVRHYDYRARSSGTDETRRPKAGRHTQPRPAFTFAPGKTGAQPIRQVLEFFPLPALSALGDPLAALADGCQPTEQGLVSAVADRLAKQLGRAPSKGAARKTSPWVLKLEQRGASWDAMSGGWKSWAGTKGANTAAWSAASAFLRSAPAESAPTDEELERLARLALFSPGCVLWRAVERVFSPSANSIGRIAAVTKVSAGALRGYLDTPEFHKLFERPGHRDHRLAVRNAIFEGNLESVLDEYLSVLAGLGDREILEGREERALGLLETALQIRTSSVDMNRLGRSGRFKLRCHAALPFGLTTAEVVSETTKKLRSDFLRVAFNSPFRPFVLATTSIGQEGLDFHLYCNQLVHWDLPSNPVDLEQREGRIRRFGSLAVRKKLAEHRRPLTPGISPWRAVSGDIQESAGGLAPWWSIDGGKIRTSVYLAPFSKERDALRRLLSSLALYRLTLGQPDQEQLVQALQRRVESAGTSAADLQQWLRAVRIRLSPYFGGAAANPDAEARRRQS